MIFFLKKDHVKETNMKTYVMKNLRNKNKKKIQEYDKNEEILY
jgi:hypothetical protein